ncbi:MAG: heavy metal translocating P-type ATPase metal-binding domain-containing protein, partial [Myxococcales bacterium]|nr:heavy metal translocating P-type ATPase metal-binding domain-containing protein [Myxococcales bacterium]
MSATPPLHQEPVPCDHCGLPVPKGLLRPKGEAQYCCNGCEMAALLLNEHGLDSIYNQTLEGKPTREAKSNGKAGTYEHFNDPAFQKLYTRPYGESALLEIELYLEGVHCAACVWLLEKLPSLLEGVHESRVDFRRSALRLVWDPNKQT